MSYLKRTDYELCVMSATDPVAAEVLMHRWRGAINKATHGDEGMELYILEKLPRRLVNYQPVAGASFYSWLSRCLSGLRSDYRRSASQRIMAIENMEHIPVVDVGLFVGETLPEGLRSVAWDISRGQTLQDLKREWGPAVADVIVAELKKVVTGQ